MTKKFSFALILTIIALSIFAQQVPQALNYQAVARTATGLIIPAQNVNVRFSVLDGSVNGNALYVENHSTTTNNFGLFTLSIGAGTPVSGTFASIDWGSGDKFLKVEIAADGSSSYQLQGTTQLLSVPYALYSRRTHLVAGNAISISNGNIINANYQAGTGINITGNLISHNLVAGNGINITGNTISNTGNSYWIPDANGIHSSVPKIGIGLDAHIQYPLHIRQQPSNVGPGGSIAFFESEDDWHASIALKNNPSNTQFTLIVGGTTNTAGGVGNFSIFNQNTFTHSLVATKTNNYVGIGMSNGSTPRSRLHVFSGDVNIDQIGSGIIMKSPNGSCWRVTVDNSGNLVSTPITCL